MCKKLQPGPDAPRWYDDTVDGNVYVIRDVWTKDVGKRGCKWLERCEYATISDGNVVWTGCREGCDFSEILPLGKASQINYQSASARSKLGLGEDLGGDK